MGLTPIIRSKEELYQMRLDDGFPPIEIDNAVRDGIFKNLDEILSENPKDQKYLFVDTHEEDRLLRASLGFMGGLNSYHCLGLMHKHFHDDWKDHFSWYRFFKREDFVDYKIIMCSELLNNRNEVNVSWEETTTKRFVKYHQFKETPCYHLMVDIPHEHELYITHNVLNSVFSDYCDSRLRY